MDPVWFRKVLGQYPTGVCVVTGIGVDGEPTGLVVGSFSSVSLDPPTVGFFPDRASSSWPKIRPSNAFCVNVLAQDQEDLCRQFAAVGGDKFAGVSWRPAASGSPVIDHVVAWIDCELAGVHDVGDHDLVLGLVLELDIERPSNPLLFFQGGYGRFRPH
ncbi:MAG: 3-hydroxy-9,10-secoandrosta,3,5(10)-triene-9,17-dione monooxygenase reductase component [Thermoleophilaceae bacterium]|nr:3-hydroxy-9,10-secoandrosta,3,5(10)-triene-9,17-dione monooxygenase reductase component [Thermoleophilaceae bacterium]